jgi:hypothetical protein
MRTLQTDRAYARRRDRGAGHLGRSGRKNEEPHGSRGNGDAAGSAATSQRSGERAGEGSGEGSGATKNDAADRPGASGHRFGPELACSECGISWDVHQREPKPCRTEVVPDVFARRPSGNFDDDASAATESVASAKERDES